MTQRTLLRELEFPENEVPISEKLLHVVRKDSGINDHLIINKLLYGAETWKDTSHLFSPRDEEHLQCRHCLSMFWTGR